MEPRGGIALAKARFSIRSQRKIPKRCFSLLLSLHRTLADNCFAIGEASNPEQEKNRAETRFFSWRRRRDSNPRTRLPRSNDLANRPLEPLGYPSVLDLLYHERGYFLFVTLDIMAA